MSARSRSLDAEGEAIRISGCHADVTAQAAATHRRPSQPVLLLERLARSIERAARYPASFAVISIELARPDASEESAAAIAVELRRTSAGNVLRAREEHPTLRNNDLVARLKATVRDLLDG